MGNLIQKISCFGNFESKPESDDEKPPPLKNIGELCYMNSTMQALGSCKKMINDLIEIQNSHHLDSKRLSQFIKLLNALNSKSAQEELDEFIVSYGWKKEGQQDSFDMLAFFLNLIYNDVKSEEESRSDKNDKYMDQIDFPGRIRMSSKTKCECASDNKRVTTNIALHLPLAKKDSSGSCSIQEMINGVLKEDPIDDNCDKCHKKQSLVISIEDDPPNTLCLHIQANVFDFTTETMIKPDYKLTFPFLLQISKKKYDLVSFVEHAGTVEYGHYVAYRKCKHKWFKVNDHIITALENVRQPNVYCSKPYLLFYEAV